MLFRSGMVAHRLPRRVTFSVCFVLVGAVSHVPFAMGLPLPVLVAGAVVAGGAAGALNPILGAVELERVPAFMRARVFGLLTAVAWAGMPIGGLLAGIAVDLAGLTVCFAVAGAVYVAVTLVPLRGGVWRLMERDAVALHVPARAG